MSTPTELERQNSSGQGRFRIVTRMIMAMKRFQASLNPSYTYGKRATDEAAAQDAAVKAAHDARAGQHAKGRTASGRTISGQPTAPGQAHGHKGDLLFRTLPETEAA